MLPSAALSRLNRPVLVPATAVKIAGCVVGGHGRFLVVHGFRLAPPRRAAERGGVAGGYSACMAFQALAIFRTLRSPLQTA